jgi:hypothetical protein
MSNLKLSGRVAALLAAVAVLAVLILGWVALVSPQRSKAAELSTKVDLTQAQVVATQAYVDSPSTKQSVNDLKRLQKVLPDSPKVSQILRQLSAAATVAGVELDTITPAAPVPSSGGEAMPIALSLRGHYFNLSRFIKLLQAQAGVNGSTVKGSGRLYSVDTITFSGGGGSATAGTPGSSGGAPTISATVALNAFIYATAAAVPATTSGTTSSDTSTTTTSTSTSSP